MFGSCSGVLTGMAAFFIPFRLEKVNIHFFHMAKVKIQRVILIISSVRVSARFAGDWFFYMVLLPVNALQHTSSYSELLSQLCINFVSRKRLSGFHGFYSLCKLRIQLRLRHAADRCRMCCGQMQINRSVSGSILLIRILVL